MDIDRAELFSVNCGFEFELASVFAATHAHFTFVMANEAEQLTAIIVFEEENFSNLWLSARCEVI